MIEVYLRTYDRDGEFTDLLAYAGKDRGEAQAAYQELLPHYPAGTPIWKENVDGGITNVCSLGRRPAHRRRGMGSSKASLPAGTVRSAGVSAGEGP